jgi:hypothetical protein
MTGRRIPHKKSDDQHRFLIIYWAFFKLSCLAFSRFLKKPFNKKLCCTASRSSFSFTELCCQVIKRALHLHGRFSGHLAIAPQGRYRLLFSLLLALFRLSVNSCCVIRCRLLVVELTDAPYAVKGNGIGKQVIGKAPLWCSFYG